MFAEGRIRYIVALFAYTVALITGYGIDENYKEIE
jgi:hypothetical protein